jgi:DNA polymerase I-like protein with 3'-5' exonuclease and polymerase domains
METEILNYIPKSYPLQMNYIGLVDGQEQMFQPDFEEFKKWALNQYYLQVDYETPVTKHVRERKIITVQFGDLYGDQQWGFQWSYLTGEQQQFIFHLLESTRWVKIIQNAAFEIVVSLNYNVRVRNVYDTMLMERILWCGYEGVHKVSAALEEIVKRRLNFEMIKDEGPNFGDNIITTSKIRYMCRDVQFLGLIMKQQMLELHLHDLEYVAALENESVIGFAQMSWEGMELNREEWLANLDWAMPLVEEAEQKLNEWLQKEPFRRQAIKLKYINTEEQILINWNSNTQRKLIAERMFPGCGGATKPVLTKWIVQAQGKYSTELMEMAYEFMDRKQSQSLLLDEMLQNHKAWLIQNELLRPAGTCIINWNSVDQVLPLLQVVNPRMENMNADSMGKFSHPIGLDIENYKEMLKLVSSYGEKFLTHIDPDGKVRTNFNQILSTGRVASSDPNLQQVPAKEKTGMRYRNCFKPPPGCKFVSSDYVSQELVIIAYITGDKNWQEALRKKQDLHSMASELVFATDKNPFHRSWKQAAEPDCAYYKQVRDEKGRLELAKQKCKCPKHKVIRDACKTINFMLAYGGTEYRLAALLRISLSESRILIRDYFTAMPAIGKVMTYLGRFGMRNGYIQTLAPFYRKRWFPEWEYRKQFLDEHLAGIRNDKYLSEIDKASKNQPIQGSSADCTKIAICMVMWELDEKQMHDAVKLVLQVHDQLDTVCRDDYAEIWKPRLTEIMEEAALVVIPNGLLKAETTITSVWSK